MKRLACLFGWHQWYIDPRGHRAKCIHCGTEVYA